MLQLNKPRQWLDHAGALILPRTCPGCGKKITGLKEVICLRCLTSLPGTGFFEQSDNPVERLFWGRTNVAAAGSQYYFTRGSSIQRILHALKYKGNRSAGQLLGSCLGESLLRTARFKPLDAIIPLPLHPERHRMRGYNQAECIARGCADVIGKPVWKEAVLRVKKTETQTKKSRLDRWDNLAGVFAVVHPERIGNRHLLLVDDVVTTGASLEACAQAILTASPASLRIATVAYATQ
jgi:ComF family protein